MSEEKHNDPQYRQWKPGTFDGLGNPIPSPLMEKEEAGIDARIQREKALYERGFPAGGHDIER